MFDARRRRPLLPGRSPGGPELAEGAVFEIVLAGGNGCCLAEAPAALIELPAGGAALPAPGPGCVA